MDSSPPVQAAPRDRDRWGKQLPDPVGNQAPEESGKGVPSHFLGMLAPKQESGNWKPDPVSQVPTLRPSVRELAARHTGAKLVYGKGLPVYGICDAGQPLGSTGMLPVTPDTVVKVTGRATLVGAPVKSGERPLARFTSITETIEGRATYVRVKLDPVLRVTNADFMFSDGQFHTKKNGHRYYKYPCLTAAEDACHRVNKGGSYEIKVVIDPNCDAPEKECNSDCEEELDKGKRRKISSDEGESADTRLQSSELHHAAEFRVMKPAGIEDGTCIKTITMEPRLFNWLPVKEFCSIEGNECATQFKFDVAEKFGSICASVSMTDCTDVGNLIFPGVISYLAQAFEKKLSWGGNIPLEYIMISANGTCAIVPVPTEKATDLNITKDLTKVVYDLAELYRVDGKLPPYIEDMFTLLKDIPDGIANNSALLQQTMLQFINHAWCLPDHKIMALLQEFFVFFKNLDEAAKKKFNEELAEVCNNSWQDVPEIDCLLNMVLKETRTLQATVGDQATYVRHVGVHVTDQMFKIWLQLKDTMQAYVASSKSELKGETEPLPRFVLKERLMLIAYYFGNFIPKFFRALFGAMATVPWVEDLCRPFLRKKHEIAAAPFGSIDLEKLEIGHNSAIVDQ